MLTLVDDDGEVVFVFMLLAGNAVEDVVVGASVDSSMVDDVVLLMDDQIGLHEYS